MFLFILPYRITNKLSFVFLPQQIWTAPLSGYRFAVLIVNRDQWPANVTTHLEDFGIPPKTSVTARDLWEVLFTNKPYDIHTSFFYFWFAAWNLISICGTSPNIYIYMLFYAA